MISDAEDSRRSRKLAWTSFVVSAVAFVLVGSMLAYNAGFANGVGSFVEKDTTASGKECVRFKWKGNWYDECIDLDYHEPWCATSYDSETGNLGFESCVKPAPVSAPAPSPAPPAVPKCESGSPHQYLGCYQDDAQRDLKAVWIKGKHSIESCKQKCAGYKYFALQYHGQCFCDDHYSSESKYKKLPDGECGGDKLGKTYTNAVFGCGADTSGADTSKRETATYLGCYKDDKQRDLQGEWFKGKHSIESCNEKCAGYKYFALQYHGQCFCGDHYSSESKYKKLSDDECGDDKLGKTYTNAVFTTY